MWQANSNKDGLRLGDRALAEVTMEERGYGAAHTLDGVSRINHRRGDHRIAGFRAVPALRCGLPQAAVWHSARATVTFGGI
jgi:hypothetical protein